MVVMVDLVVILMVKALIMLMIVMIIIDLPAVGKPIKVEPQQYLRPADKKSAMMSTAQAK